MGACPCQLHALVLTILGMYWSHACAHLQHACVYLLSPARTHSCKCPHIPAHASPPHPPQLPLPTHSLPIHTLSFPQSPSRPHHSWVHTHMHRLQPDSQMILLVSQPAELWIIWDPFYSDAEPSKGSRESEKIESESAWTQCNCPVRQVSWLLLFHTSIHPPIYPSIHPSIHPSSIHSPVHPSIHLLIYPSFILAHTHSSEPGISFMVLRTLWNDIGPWYLFLKWEYLESSFCLLLALWPWSYPVILKPQFPHLLNGNKGASSQEECWALGMVAMKVTWGLLCPSSKPSLKILIQKDTCIPMFTTELFTLANHESNLNVH